nr:histidinol phosphatase [Acinetobacter baumannii]
LRLSLGKSQDTSDLEKIHSEIQSFINELTNSNTEIKISVKSHATEYSSKWSKNNPIEFYKIDDGNFLVDEGNIKDRFPVHLYSQKQINALASHPNILLEIIDRSPSVNTNYYKDLISIKNNQIMNLLAEERALKNSISMEGSLKSELGAINTNILSFQSGGHNNILINHEVCMNVQRALISSLDMSDLNEKLYQISNSQLPKL